MTRKAALVLVRLLAAKLIYMNINRRKMISQVISILESQQQFLEEALSEEQDYFDNMPEGLQNGSKGEAASTAISALEISIDFLIEAIENANEALNN